MRRRCERLILKLKTTIALFKTAIAASRSANPPGSRVVAQISSVIRIGLRAKDL